MLKADGWVNLFVSADIVKNMSYMSESINVHLREGYVRQFLPSSVPFFVKKVL